MAKTATAENIAEKGREPQFRSAVQLIRGGIVDVASKMGTLREKIGEHWAKIEEGYKVHPQAGKWFAKLDKLEPEERQDILRSFKGCCEAAGWPEETDLVDSMEAPQAADADDDMAEPAPKPRRVSATEAKAAAARHLKAVPDAPVYEGDNADLADE